ncbi:MAG: DUF2846 domain-containing protein [Bacteroidota bacterium]
MRTVIIVLLLVLALPAGAKAQQSGDSTPASEKEATLYFYRKPEFFNGRFDCWLNETRLIKNFQAASYFWLNIPAGTYEMKTSGKPTWSIAEKKYELRVEAGEVYYIEAVINYDFLGTALFLEVRSQEDFDQLQTKITFDERAIRSLD